MSTAEPQRGPAFAKASASRARGMAGRLRRGFAGFRTGFRGDPEPAAPESTPQSSYEELYEAHAQSEGVGGIGGGDFDTMGEIELDLLREEGLLPHHCLVDFGCGSGRLAVHAIPYLDGGRYVGIDISETFLAHARAATEPLTRQGGCDVVWQLQDDLDFDLAPGSVDLFCAFSVFTHMEHEDTYRYLEAIRPLMAPDGKLVLSCLPLSHSGADEVFRTESALSLTDRWSRVRNIVTFVEFMDYIVRMAGWSTVSWRRGEADVIPAADGSMRKLGQSILTIKPK